MSAFHLKTEIVSVGSVCQMCETTEFREGLPDTHFLVISIIVQAAILATLVRRNFHTTELKI